MYACINVYLILEPIYIKLLKNMTYSVDTVEVILGICVTDSTGNTHFGF